MKTNLTLKINSGLIDNKGLGLTIGQDGHILWSTDYFQEPESKIKITVDLPARIDFTITGRKDNDTQVNEAGEIIADRYLSLIWFEIEDKLVYTYGIDYKILQYHGDDVDPNAPAFYWNRNGVATLVIDRPDPVLWLLDHPEVW